MWGNSFAIGQYVPLNSPIHRLDPRVKIVFAGISIIDLFILQDWLSFLLWGGVILLLAFLSHISFSYLLKSLRPLLFLLILTLVLHFFFTPGEYIWEYGFLHISREGISKGLLIVVRLCLLILVTAI
ncbi:MAG TPA: energy-coupling factor transporter transmembrane component T, partial [Candidatus Atribacteria bacterium]|nr:energy-coupling factor transporter transmembrane component T [Candidatus Atribacteria bacterium]